MRNAILAIVIFSCPMTLFADHGLHHFGKSLSISGDRFAVGSSYGTGKTPVGIGSGKKTGNVRLYQFDGEALSQTNSIHSTDGIAGDEFGHAVQLVGLDIAVGAFNENNSGEGAGAAYLLTATSDGWVEGQVRASDGAAGDGFGASLAFLNGVALVGAPRNDEKGDNAGAVYVYKGSGASWSEVQKLTPSDSSADQRFGQKVVMAGSATVFIGAAGDKDNGSNSGAVYIFTYDGSRWNQNAKLKPSTSTAGARFGNTLHYFNDRLAVGSFFDSSEGTAKGAVYIFKRDGAVWAEEAKLNVSDGLGGDNFGSAVAMDSSRVIVGSPAHAGIGAAYVFKREGSTWLLEQKIVANDSKAAMNFGQAVAIENEIALVGALNSNSTQVGSVYLYQLLSSTWTKHSKLTFEEIFFTSDTVQEVSSRVTDEVSDSDYYGEDEKKGGCFIGRPSVRK